MLVKKEMALHKVGFWDSKGREAALSQEETETGRIVREDYCKWASLEEVYRR